MVPMQTILYPYFKVMSDLRLTDKYFGLILSFATFQIPIMTYQYAAYLKKIPSSLIEAGRIDGASIMQVITYIMIPVSQPVMVTAGLVSFAWMWNEILLPIMILQTPRMQTLIVSLSSLKGQYGTSPTLVCAGAFIGILPVSLMYVFFQRHLLQGMTAGALKG
jgi:ABC-type glycerol-3-phosphate transport system permease component